KRICHDLVVHEKPDPSTSPSQLNLVRTQRNRLSVGGLSVHADTCLAATNHRGVIAVRIGTGSLGGVSAKTELACRLHINDEVEVDRRLSANDYCACVALMVIIIVLWERPTRAPGKRLV